jgi:NADH-quinone oxidoreductase subunit N
MMVGVVAFSPEGVNALVFYLAAYALMNLAAFAVVTLRERRTQYGDDIASVQGLGREAPLEASALTVSMLGLSGLPGTAGFIGKLFLIEAAVEADYTWLGVAIAIGTMISLAYYLRVVAAIWMRPSPAEAPPSEALPAMAGGSPEADRAGRCRTILALTALAAAATVFFGIVPSPLVDWASAAGDALAPFLG